MDTSFIIDNFVNVQAGGAYRLFPFGVIYKGGKRREITRESASTFKLPHFKPPIKLGSHADATPAGGQITALEVREDGLYAVPELTEQGVTAFERGDYRYHSPEVIWDDGAIEDPATGQMIYGPLIIGDALLHTPHLGEAAALYTFEPQRNGDNPMSDQENIVNVPESVWDKFTALFSRAEKVIETDAEQFTALKSERDQFAAELETLKAEKARADLLTGIVAELQCDKFGSMYIEMGKAQEAAEYLARMDNETRDWCMRNFSALSAQAAHPELFQEQGSNAPAPSSPAEMLENAIKAYQAEHKTDFVDAYEAVKREQPELFEKGK